MRDAVELTGVETGIGKQNLNDAYGSRVVVENGLNIVS
jgi:hypothetical protein